MTVSRATQDAMRAILPEVAKKTIEAITHNVESYSLAFTGPMGQVITRAVEQTLIDFIELIASSEGVTPTPPAAHTLQEARRLGRSEAASSRSIDSVLSAFRIGASTSWSSLARVAMDNKCSTEDISMLAAMLFAYIDSLSAECIAGYSDRANIMERERIALRERLARLLVEGAPETDIRDLMPRVDWRPSPMLTVLCVPSTDVRRVRSIVGSRNLELTEQDSIIVLLPLVDARLRKRLAMELADVRAVLGPTVPRCDTPISYQRAIRCNDLRSALGEGWIDADAVLGELLTADAQLRTELRERITAPLACLKASAAQKLSETLHAWVLLQGRRDAIARHLYVHPQTVRYRVTQLRELYGDRLTDPHFLWEVSLAFGPPQWG